MMTSDEVRRRICLLHYDHLGKTDPLPYWQSVGVIRVDGTMLDRAELVRYSRHASWCGAYAFAIGRECGLWQWPPEQARVWVDTRGMVYPPPKSTGRDWAGLPTTKTPRPGDITHWPDRKQHYGTVLSVADDRVTTVDGNVFGVVVRRSHPPVPDVIYFDIEPEIERYLQWTSG